jgi:hypothetical protein
MNTDITRDEQIAKYRQRLDTLDTQVENLLHDLEIKENEQQRILLLLEELEEDSDEHI